MFTKPVFGYGPDDIIEVKINRQQLMMELLNDIKTRFKDTMKVVYAYYVPDFDDMHQFMLICRQQQVIDNKPTNVYAILPVVKFGERCLEVYYLCKRDAKLTDFFKNFFSEACTFDERKFNAFINYQCGLSTVKISDRYWKKPENAKALLTNAEDMAKITATVLMNRK